MDRNSKKVRLTSSLNRTYLVILVGGNGVSNVFRVCSI